MVSGVSGRDRGAGALCCWQRPGDARRASVLFLLPDRWTGTEEPRCDVSVLLMRRRGPGVLFGVQQCITEPVHLCAGSSCWRAGPGALLRALPVPCGVM